MNKPFRPLLAAETPEQLQMIENTSREELLIRMRVFQPHLPLYASYKLDGIRAIAREGVLVSRTLKPIPSKFAQQFAQRFTEGYDGELIARKVPADNTVYSATYSAVMTHGSEEPLDFHVFDCVYAEFAYCTRLEKLAEEVSDPRYLSKGVRLLEQRFVRTVEEILEYERQALDLGYEGLVLRRPNAPYKYGRSTFNQGYLMKFARWLTSEAEIIGFEEMMHNDNPAEIDARGLTRRSTHQANLRPSGMLGNFIVKDPKFAESFSLSGQMDHTFRKHALENFDTQYKGSLAKYKYKPYGTKDKPRQPIFVGLRSREDM